MHDFKEIDKKIFFKDKQKVEKLALDGIWSKGRAVLGPFSLLFPMSEF